MMVRLLPGSTSVILHLSPKVYNSRDNFVRYSNAPLISIRAIAVEEPNLPQVARGHTCHASTLRDISTQCCVRH
jgi:hypothetical protein